MPHTVDLDTSKLPRKLKLLLARAVYCMLTGSHRAPCNVVGRCEFTSKRRSSCESASQRTQSSGHAASKRPVSHWPRHLTTFSSLTKNMGHCATIQGDEEHEATHDKSSLTLSLHAEQYKLVDLAYIQGIFEFSAPVR